MVAAAVLHKDAIRCLSKLLKAEREALFLPPVEEPPLGAASGQVLRRVADGMHAVLTGIIGRLEPLSLLTETGFHDLCAESVKEMTDAARQRGEQPMSAEAAAAFILSSPVRLWGEVLQDQQRAAARAHLR